MARRLNILLMCVQNSDRDTFSPLNHRISHRADAVDLDFHHVAGSQREIIGRNNTSASEQKHAIGKAVVAREPGNQIVKRAGHLLNAGLA